MLSTAARRMASTTVRAVVNQEKGKASILSVPVPKLRDEYILVKTKAVALNPTDVSHIGFLATPGHRFGCGMLIRICS
jgi:NADPH:quinone reductase-like Zn-dependent oxidoreductase